MITLSYEQAGQLIQLFTDRFIRKDYAAFFNLFTDNVVFEFPYTPEPNPKRLDGKAALQQYVKKLEKMFDITSFTNPVIHVAADAPVFFAQFEGSGKNLVTGRSYEQSYIAVVEVHDGKIVHYKEYWNPLALT